MGDPEAQPLVEGGRDGGGGGFDYFRTSFVDKVPSVMTVYVAASSGDTPVVAKVVGTLVLIYVVSGVNLIPSFVPFAELLSDIFVLPLGIWITAALAGMDIMGRVAPSADAAEHPMNWFGAVFTVLLMVAVVTWSLHVVFLVLGATK